MYVRDSQGNSYLFGLGAVPGPGEWSIGMFRGTFLEVIVHMEQFFKPIANGQCAADTISGDDAMALAKGLHCRAFANGSCAQALAWGHGAQAVSSYSALAVGDYSIAFGDYLAVAIGVGARAVALNGRAIAYGPGSTAIGMSSARADSYAMVTHGAGSVSAPRFSIDEVAGIGKPGFWYRKKNDTFIELEKR